jgi:FKBP-type peptidyl-prolyl cis-trans isomerase
VAAPAGRPAAGNEAASYELGLAFGNQLHHGGVTTEISMGALVRGVKDGLGGKQPSMAEKQAAAQFLRTERNAVGERNKAASREFLARNAQKPGFKTTASGLQYLVIKPGDLTAKSPDAESQVTVQYHGRLIDGTEFDNSSEHGQAAIFRMNSILKGWQEALSMMKPGAQWRIFVPPELGYDLRTPPSIPPGSLLIYDLDLIRINAIGQFGPAPGANPSAGKPANPKLGASAAKP